MPSQEFGGQANILPLLANGERELAVFDHDFQMMFCRVEHGNPRHLGGAESIGCELRDFFVPFNDVNLLAAQLPDDGLDTHALHAHTGAHGVYIAVSGDNGNLGALPRLAGDGLDQNSSVIYLRNLHFKKPLNEGSVGAGKHHLCAFGIGIHLFDYDPQPVPNAVVLQPRLLAPGQPPFMAAQVHNNIGAFDPLHHTLEQLTGALAVFRKHDIALGFPDFLHDDLLGGLCGNAAQHIGRFRYANLAAHLGSRVYCFRLFETNFRIRVGDILHNGADGIYTDVAGFRIELRTHRLLGAVVFPGSHHHSVFQGGDDNRRVNALLAAQLINGLRQYTQCHKSFPAYSSITKLTEAMSSKGTCTHCPSNSKSTLSPANSPKRASNRFRPNSSDRRRNCTLTRQPKNRA